MGGGRIRRAVSGRVGRQALGTGHPVWWTGPNQPLKLGTRAGTAPRSTGGSGGARYAAWSGAGFRDEKETQIKGPDACGPTLLAGGAQSRPRIGGPAGWRRPSGWTRAASGCQSRAVPSKWVQWGSLSVFQLSTCCLLLASIFLLGRRTDNSGQWPGGMFGHYFGGGNFTCQ
jgi:hypothetical protein